MLYFDYNTWCEIYHNKKILKVNNYFDNNDIKLLDKLGVKIEESHCSEYQYDIIKQQLYDYYIDEEELPEIQEKIKKYSKSLESVSVTQEEYNTLLEKIRIIDEMIYSTNM